MDIGLDLGIGIYYMIETILSLVSFVDSEISTSYSLEVEYYYQVSFFIISLDIPISSTYLSIVSRNLGVNSSPFSFAAFFS